MKASILAVGTELTIGQIVNKNASWISAQLKNYGVQVVMHLTVPDDRKLILEALKWAENQSELIFVTGGLGPTSDDFTRDLIAEWAQKDLVFNEASWQHIIDRLSPRGYTVRDIQKQQCYFPQGAEVLKNVEGTANGFFMKSEKISGEKKVFVLPGPPREVEAIWKDHIAKWLHDHTQNLPKLVTRAWDTMGMGESDVADLVENILKDRPKSDSFEIGYRVHLPYVEVKLSYLETEASKWQPYISAVDAALKKITITTDFTDLASAISDRIKKFDFTFYDYVTGGYLQNRLSGFLKTHPRYSWKQSNEKPLVELFENEENFLALLPLEDDKSLLIFEFAGRRKQFIIEAPMKSPLMVERRKQYTAEMALAHFGLS